MADRRPLSATRVRLQGVGVTFCISIGVGPDANERALISATTRSPLGVVRAIAFADSLTPERTSLIPWAGSRAPRRGRRHRRPQGLLVRGNSVAAPDVSRGRAHAETQHRVARRHVMSAIGGLSQTGFSGAGHAAKSGPSASVGAVPGRALASGVAVAVSPPSSLPRFPPHVCRAQQQQLIAPR
jgi:hypothetical protein